MQGQIRLQQRGISEEAARLTHHRAATPAGEAVIAETRERVLLGLNELEHAAAELGEAALAVHAVRARMVIEAVRDDLARVEPVPPAPLKPLQAVIIDALTGLRVGRAGAGITAWSPRRALRPAWTVAAPAGTLRFAGSELGRRVVVGTGSIAVLDASDGSPVSTWEATLLDCWEEEALVATDSGVEVRSLLNGKVSLHLTRPLRPSAGWILPDGILLRDAQGISLLSTDGRCLGQGRFGQHVVLSEDRRTLVAFPMMLRLPDLQPLGGLNRPPHLDLSAFYLDREFLIGWGKGVVLWRLADASAPKPLAVSSEATGVTRQGSVLFVHAAGGDAAFDLGQWPPRPLDAFEAIGAESRVSLPTMPNRFVFGEDTRIDRVRGSPAEKANLCRDIARFAAGHARSSSSDVREIAGGILRDALVVECEVLVQMAAALSDRLALRPEQADFAAWDIFLDRVLKPMLMLELLPGFLDETSSRRVRGLLAECAGEALASVGERLSERALRGAVADGEIETSMAALSEVRMRVLARAPGLGWIGLDVVMRRWKRLGQEARELADIAVATRAIERLAQASVVIRGADASVDDGAVRRLGQSIGDLAARSAAEAEIDGLLSRDGLHERIAEGMERARKDLGGT